MLIINITTEDGELLDQVKVETETPIHTSAQIVDLIERHHETIEE